jgi:ClpP class serine protease
MEEPKSDQLSKISNYISIAIGVVILGNHVKNGLSNLLSKIKEYYSHTVALISLVGNVQGGKKDCINLELHKEQITSAFKAHHVKAVVLVINTPGGSPVEASKLYTYLVSMKKKYPHKPLFAVTEECCASAGYYIACACDFIYSDASSIVGSIGVLSGGFGMEELVKKWGIEPRYVFDLDCFIHHTHITNNTTYFDYFLFHVTQNSCYRFKQSKRFSIRSGKFVRTS